MEIVWHGHYAKYFEIARCALLEKITYNYQQMKESGYAWPIIELKTRYIKPATFGQDIVVRARIVECDLRLKIDYLITDAASGARLTKRSEEHTSELQSLMRISYAVFFLKKKNEKKNKDQQKSDNT